MGNSRSLYLQRRGEVAHLIIDRPHRRNAFTDEMWPILADLAREADRDDRTKMMVVRGTDSTVFCAGADVAEWAERLSRGEGGAQNGEMVLAGVSAVADMKKPTVAAIQGACMGGGAAISMACDLRVADRTARFSLPPARVGLAFPYAALRSLVAAVGEAQAKWLLFTGEVFDADRAVQIGFLSAVYEPQFFPSKLDELLTVMCSMSQISLQSMKAMMKMVARGQTTDNRETERIWRELAAGPDHAAGVGAFLEKWRRL
ncbi:MAG: enoyl-CoA hydratase/isomerase family protein [Actinomycetia bacterium]|nr:enoyl-CoA hydratase/isomerase family protein [Actinomycetes bacterium]